MGSYDIFRRYSVAISSLYNDTAGRPLIVIEQSTGRYPVAMRT